MGLACLFSLAGLPNHNLLYEQELLFLIGDKKSHQQLWTSSSRLESVERGFGRCSQSVIADRMVFTSMDSYKAVLMDSVG